MNNIKASKTIIRIIFHHEKGFLDIMKDLQLNFTFFERHYLPDSAKYWRSEVDFFRPIKVLKHLNKKTTLVIYKAELLELI